MNDAHAGPNLLEREGELQLISAAATEAFRGEGRVIAVTGDAGAGKSSLVRVASSLFGPVRSLRGDCDPLSTPRPLGPIRDILLELDNGDVISDAARIPPAQIAESLFASLATEPTVAVVEDAQWIDEASVEVLRFLSRRIGAMPVLLLLTYRNGEIGATHPLRSLLGDLARGDRASSMTLRPLSAPAIARLIAGTPLNSESVLQATGGNPFFVTEIARHPDETIPASVRDAVLASTGHLSSSDLEMLQLLASAPDGVGDRVLVSLAVNLPALRRLEGTGLLVRSPRGIAFRHELARLAIEDSIPPGAGAGFHAKLLAALEASGSREWAALTHHARAAADHARTTRFALAAASESVTMGAHLEAVAFFTQALAQFDGPPQARAATLERLSFEQYMVNRLDDAIASITEALRIRHSEGDVPGLAAAHERRSLFAYYAASRADAEEHARLSGLAAIEAGDELREAGAIASSAFLAYRRNGLAEALAGMDAARKIARQGDNPLLVTQCDIVTSAAKLLLEGPAARESLVSNIDVAVSRSFDELASMGFTNLAGIDVEQRRFRDAEDALERSIPFAISRDITVCQATQTGVRSRMQLLRGRWQAAFEDARTVLDAQWAPVARFWPHLALALLASRRGEAGDDFHAAWRLARELDEPMLTLAALAALAERAWLTGEDDARLRDAPDLLRQLRDTPGLEWSKGDLVVWLQRIGVEVPDDVAVAEPYRLLLQGRAREAAAWWRRAGAPFDEAMALLFSDDQEDQVAAVATFDAMGATATADRARQELRRQGVTSLPARPRTATRSNPAGLTNRQLEVARLIAQGLTNAELAQRLYISEKTADHHVSAVLGKLGLASRREVMRRSAEFGLD